jgi:transposase InsO family protein
LKGRQVEQGCIFHTDRGIEHTAYRFNAALQKEGFVQSFNRPGGCTDNAHVESFFYTMKPALFRERKFQNEKELRYALNRYINHLSNKKRLHSGMGYNTPVKYERMVA